MGGNLGRLDEIPGRMNTSIAALTSWRRVGAVSPTSLVDARLQLHHALQIIVAAPISLLPAKPDDSHTNLEWLPTLEALGTNWLDGGTRLRFALRPAELALLAIDASGAELATYPLSGHTVADGVVWLRAALDRAGYPSERLTMKKHYEIPAHPVTKGATFSQEPVEAFAELSRYYANAHDLTSQIATTRAGASEPRCWPHHFDLATLITLPSAPGGQTRTVGFGLSPGDDSYAEPYFYVGPYPHPPVDRLKPISLGAWHTRGWVGAVLRGSDLLRFAGAEQQAKSVLEFANEAIDGSIEALG